MNPVDHLMVVKVNIRGRYCVTPYRLTKGKTSKKLVFERVFLINMVNKLYLQNLNSRINENMIGSF